MPQVLTIVGAGPGGLAPLFAAASSGNLRDLLRRGVTIIEKSNDVGAGLLKDVTINSDSAAEAFLDILAQSHEPELLDLLQHPAAIEIAGRRGQSVPLTLAAQLLQVASEALLRIVDNHPGCRVLLGTEVLHVRRRSATLWQVTSRNRFGKVESHTSASVHLATGAHQPLERLETELVAGRPLLPSHSSKLMQTGDLFTHKGLAQMERMLSGKPNPKIVIVGGSTSAGAAAAYLLRRSKVVFGPAGVTIMHRSPLRLYYPSVEEAHADGYRDFSAEDLCPITGRVFRLSGFRFDSKDLLRNAFSLTAEAPDERLRLFAMHGREDEAQRLLHDADLVIAALGYIPRMCDLRDELDAPIHLHRPRSGDWAMVDQTCTVLTREGLPVDGVTAMGLAIGPAASREMGGEAGFRGQVNSLWLWQNRLGLRVVESALRRVQSQQIPFLRPQPPRLSHHLHELQQLEESNTYTNFGPINTRFEQALIATQFDGHGACSTTCNATLALMLAIRNAIGEHAGSRRLALMPSFTFAAAAQAAMWCGLTPLFCDIDPETWLPSHTSEDALLELFGDQIAVVIPNSTFGNSLDLRRYEALQRSTGIPVVIDAAASLGSLDAEGRAFGTGSHLPIVFSMHATKCFATGEGGILYSADTDLIARLRAMSSFGFEGSRIPTMLGLNAKLSEVAALSALLQLESFPAQIQEREQITDWYTEALHAQFSIQQPAGQRQVRSFHSILLPTAAIHAREQIRAALLERGVQTGTYFSPHLSQQAYMQQRSLCPATPHSDAVASRILSLPLFLGMQRDEVFATSSALQECVQICTPRPLVHQADAPLSFDLLQAS